VLCTSLKYWIHPVILLISSATIPQWFLMYLCTHRVYYWRSSQRGLGMYSCRNCCKSRICTMKCHLLTLTQWLVVYFLNYIRYYQSSCCHAAARSQASTSAHSAAHLPIISKTEAFNIIRLVYGKYFTMWSSIKETLGYLRQITCYDKLICRIIYQYAYWSHIVVESIV
jgi:hypothetical protein